MSPEPLTLLDTLRDAVTTDPERITWDSHRVRTLFAGEHYGPPNTARARLLLDRLVDQGILKALEGRTYVLMDSDVLAARRYHWLITLSWSDAPGVPRLATATGTYVASIKDTRNDVVNAAWSRAIHA